MSVQYGGVIGVRARDRTRIARRVLCCFVSCTIILASCRSVTAPIMPATASLPAPIIASTETLPPYPPLPSVTPLPAGYPLPPSTIPAVKVTAMQATSIALATASVHPPLPTDVYPLVGPMCFVDQLNQFSLSLPAGWYADPPPQANAFAGASVIYNYDPGREVGAEGNPPPGNLKIQITSAKLAADQTFQQWLSDLISSDTSAAAPVPVTVTAPSPFKLGNFDGSSFVTSGYGGSVQEIALPVINGRVLVIDFMPAGSSVQSRGLSLLANSLAVSPSTFCH